MIFLLFKKVALTFHQFIQNVKGPYAKPIKSVEDDVQNCLKRVNELTGIKESDTGLAHPALWDLAADKQVIR